jgi:hypothetical protein
MKIRTLASVLLSGRVSRDASPKARSAAEGWSSDNVVRVATLYEEPVSPGSLTNVVASSRPAVPGRKNGK